MLADFVRRIYEADRPGQLPEMAMRMGRAGSTWGRVTRLPEVASDCIVMEGWLIRPEDEGPFPTPKTEDRGELPV